MGTITIMTTKKARQHTCPSLAIFVCFFIVRCRAFFVIMIVIVPMVSQIIVILCHPHHHHLQYEIIRLNDNGNYYVGLYPRIPGTYMTVSGTYAR